MTDQSINLFLIIILLIVAFGGSLYFRAFLTKRGISKVIEIFYQQNALRTGNAKTLQEMGLQPPDFFQRMTRRRDYKQNALRILIKEGIIVANEDGKFYLVEEKLAPNLRRRENETNPSH